MSQKYKQNHVLGILLSCAGYGAWVVGDTLVKLAGQTLPIIEILAIDFSVGLLCIVLLAAFHGGIAQLATRRPVFHIWRSILIFSATYGSFAGIMHLSLPDFYTIIFTSPLLLTVLASVFLKEVADRNSWLAIIFGFLGVVVAVQFSQLSGHTFSIPGVLATMLASLTLALSMLTARGAGSESNYALSFWPQMVCCIVSTITLIMAGNVVLNTPGIVYAMISGAMGALGLVLTNASLRVAPVAVVSPYHYIQIIGGALAAYVIWHSVPSLAVIVGALMIISSGLYILHHESSRAKRNSNESEPSPAPPKHQGKHVFCEKKVELQDEIVGDVV